MLLFQLEILQIACISDFIDFFFEMIWSNIRRTSSLKNENSPQKICCIQLHKFLEKIDLLRWRYWTQDFPRNLVAINTFHYNSSELKNIPKYSKLYNWFGEISSLNSLIEVDLNYNIVKKSILKINITYKTFLSLLFVEKIFVSPVILISFNVSTWTLTRLFKLFSCFSLQKDYFFL